MLPFHIWLKTIDNVKLNFVMEKLICNNDFSFCHDIFKIFLKIILSFTDMFPFTKNVYTGSLKSLLYTDALTDYLIQMNVGDTAEYTVKKGESVHDGQIILIVTIMFDSFQ